MNADEPAASDEQRSLLLAACDDALAAGGPTAATENAAVPPELRAGLERDVAWCRLVRRLLAGPEATVSLGSAGAGLAASAASSAARAWTRLGRFQIRRELGRGGFGVVLLAFDPRLGRDVALKVPRPEVLVLPELRARFQHEARAAAGLDHPNLVPVYEAGVVDSVCYIASAYCPGITLRAWLTQRTEPVPFDLAARLVATLAEAVAHAHQRGVLHRDLKPSNVMLSPPGPDAPAPLAFMPRIMDFGLAKVLDDGDAEHRTQTGAVLGTPSYMAPEQAGGHSQAIGTPADVYALGVILYEVLTGRPPFRANTPLETLRQVQTEEPAAPARLRPKLPRDLETICLKCLHKEPARRYATAQALADDLQRYLDHRPIEARRSGALSRLALWCRRKPALAGTIAVALMAVTTVAGIGAYQVLQERERYRLERDQAQANLYRALLGEARALMQARDTGWWWQAMDSVRQAAALEVADRDPTELRELAIACMGTEFPCLRLQGTWAGHGERIHAVALGPDSRRAASAGADGTARLWSVPDGRPLAVLAGHGQDVTAVAFHPGGRWLATASTDGTIRLWDGAALGPAAAAAEPARPAAAQVFHSGHGGVDALVFTADGAALAAACRSGAVLLLALHPATAAERAPRRALTGHAGPVTCLAVAANGTLASGSADKTIRLWDLDTGQATEFWALGNAPNALGFHAGGLGLTWSEPEAFGLLYRDLRTNQLVVDAQMHPAAVRHFVHDSRGRVLTASADGTIKLWRRQPGYRYSRELAVAGGAWGGVQTVAIDAGGTRVVAGYADGRVRLWELAEPPQRTLVTPGAVQRAAFLGGSRRLVTNGMLHDFTTGWDRPPQSFDPPPIGALTIQPGGHWFAFGDRDGRLAIGDLRRERPPQFCAGHSRTIRALASSPDGRLLASASTDGTVKLWDWATGACRRTLAPGLGALYALAWGGDPPMLAILGARGVALADPDGPAAPRVLHTHALSNGAIARFGKRLAWSGANGTIAVAELPAGTVRYTLRGHAAIVSALAFSADGSLLASAAPDSTLRLWDPKTGTAGAVFKHESLTGGWLGLDPLGRYLAGCGTHSTLVWDLRGQAPAAECQASTAGQFSADGRDLLLTTQQGSVERCRVADLEQARAAAQGPDKLPTQSFVPMRVAATLVHGNHVAGPWAIAASPDGRWFATGGHDQTVKLWDSATRRLVRTWEAPELVWCAAFSPDGRFLAAGTAEAGVGAVMVWEVATGREAHHWRGHRSLVMGLAFHPQRPWLASSALDGSVHLWDLQAGKPLGLLHQFDRGVPSVAFRPDGRCLAAACLDKRVAVWDLDEAPAAPVAPSRFLEGHTAGFRSVGFSADGRYLASGSEQGVIVLWDARTFARIVTLRGGTGQVREVAFSRDGGLLAGAAYVTPTIVWDLDRLRRTLAEMNLDW